MKTKIILLSILVLCPIQLLAYSMCSIYVAGLEADYNQTLFVLIVDPDFVEREKLQYVLDNVLCLLPQNPKFSYVLLDGKQQGSINEKTDLVEIQNDLSMPASNQNDFCNTLLDQVHNIVHNDKTVQLISSKSFDETCNVASTLEELTTPIHGGDFRLNLIRFDEFQVTPHNSVLIPLTSIDTASVDMPNDMRQELEKFIREMFRDRSVQTGPSIGFRPHEHHRHHHNPGSTRPDKIETWKVLAIIITVVTILLVLIIGSLLIRRKLKSKREPSSKSNSLSGEQIGAPKKVTKAPMTPSSVTPSAESAEKTKMSKERAEKTKSTLSYSITLESVKSKKKRFSKESGSKEGASKETVSHASAESADKPKMRIVEASKKVKNNVV